MNGKMFLFLTAVLFLIFSFGACSKSNPASAPSPTATATRQVYSVSFREGVSSYTGCSDTKLSENLFALNYGSSDILQVGLVGVNGVMRALIKFDVSSIPASTEIKKARLTIKLNNAIGSTFDLNLMTLGKNWNETQATWEEASTGVSWAGGDITNTSSALPASVNPVSYDTLIFEITPSIVQGWVDNPASNYGVAFLADSETSGNFVAIYSGEYATEANRPLLEIEHY